MHSTPPPHEWLKTKCNGPGKDEIMTTAGRAGACIVNKLQTLKHKWRSNASQGGAVASGRTKSLRWRQSIRAWVQFLLLQPLSWWLWKTKKKTYQVSNFLLMSKKPRQCKLNPSRSVGTPQLGVNSQFKLKCIYECTLRALCWALISVMMRCGTGGSSCWQIWASAMLAFLVGGKNKEQFQ